MKTLTNFNLAFAAVLVCGLFAGCSLSQTGQRKPVPLPVVTSVEPSGVSVEGGRFVSTPGGFTIEIPHLPTQTLDYGSEKARTKGVDVGKQYFWKFQTTVYVVMYSRPVTTDGDPMPQPFEDLVSGARKGVLRAQGKMISENKFDVVDYSGTEFKYVSAEGANFVTRLFLVGDVGYQIQGAYLDSKDQEEVLKVLGSFKPLSQRPRQ